MAATGEGLAANLLARASAHGAHFAHVLAAKRAQDRYDNSQIYY